MNTITKPIYVVGMSIITSNDVAEKEIGEHWALFLKTPIKEKLTNIISSSVFAVYSDYENGCQAKYKLTIGYAVSSLEDAPQELTAVTIPAGNYKIYQAKSRTPEDIIAVWQEIWATDANTLPRNFIADFEEYSEHGVTVSIG